MPGLTVISPSARSGSIVTASLASTASCSWRVATIATLARSLRAGVPAEHAGQVLHLRVRQPAAMSASRDRTAQARTGPARAAGTAVGSGSGCSRGCTRVRARPCAPTWPAAAPSAASGPAAGAAGRLVPQHHVHVAAADADGADTAASRVPACHSAGCLRQDRSLASPAAISACGSCTPVVGGTTPVPSASTVLISPAAPAAALAWPMFALTEPSAAGFLAPARSVLSALSSASSSAGVPAPFPSMN